MKRIKDNSYLVEERVDDISCPEKSLAQQSFAEEVDVNNIVARALKTGILGDPMAIAARQAVFGDFSGVGSYQDSLNRVIAAQKAFESLPANVRARFDHDPGKLIAFLADVKNLEEARELGLVEPLKKTDIVAAESQAAKVAVPPVKDESATVKKATA